MRNETKLHILIIPSWYPKYPGDVGGSFFREQAIALKTRGMKVGVIFPQARSVKKIFTGLNGLLKDKDNGIITYRWGHISVPKCKSFNQHRWVTRGEKLFEMYVKENGKPDIVHSHSLFNAGLLANILNEKYNIPFVITEHSTAFSRGLVSDFQIANARSAVKKAAYCIAVSNEFKLMLNEQFNTDKWSYIPNIVNDNFLKKTLIEKPGKDQIFRFINICLLDPKKKVDILINAFSIVSKKIENVELSIGGDGPELNYLKKLTVKLGLQKKIKFHGKLTRSQVLDEVLKADAFVLSSEFETFGVVLIEALALGKPVIATKCGGPESIITPEVGYLVEKNSAKAMANAMIMLYENQNNYEQNNIRNYCRQEFSEEVIVTKLTKIYNNTLKHHE